MDIKLSQEEISFLAFWLKEDLDLEKKNKTLSTNGLKLLKSVFKKIKEKKQWMYYLYLTECLADR